MLLKTSLLLAASVAGVQLMSAKVDDSKGSYTQQIETWRAQRVERLKAPNGWLSLIGLHCSRTARTPSAARKTTTSS